jgi:RHS repeat-associated protein
MQEPQKKTVSVKKCPDYANAFLWNYPFGLTMPGCSANIANPNDNYKFAGYEKDDEGGLDLYHANVRGYDPVLGRFMQVDPLASQFPAWNPYHYVYNNPMKFIDPTGLKPTGEDPDRKPKKVGIDVKGSGWNAVWANLIDRDGGSASSQSQTIDQEPSDDPEMNGDLDRQPEKIN